MTRGRAAALATVVAVLVAVALVYRTVLGTGKTSTAGTTLVPSGNAASYTVSARGGTPRPVAATARYDAEDPAWSPDGTRVAFTGTGCAGCSPAVYMLNLRTGTVRRLAAGSRPAWSRRDWIAFVRRGGDGVDRIFLMRPDGRRVHRLLRDGANGAQPSWAPDGRRIAFVQQVGDPQHGNPQVFIANADGRGATDLAYAASAVEGTPAWSPDGRRIAFSTVGPHGYWETHLMRTDGGGMQKAVSLTGNVTNPTWSPDGKRLAVMSDARRQAGFPSLYLVQVDGHGLVRLTSSATEDFSPAWSPPGDRIAFSRRRLIRIADRASTP